MPASSTVPPTEAAASLLPLGASIGPAGLGVMPYSLTFSGDFFQIANFIGGIDSLVHTGAKSNVAVDGRLVTLNGFCPQTTELRRRQIGGDPGRELRGHDLCHTSDPGHDRGRHALRAGAGHHSRGGRRRRDPGGVGAMKMPELKVPDFLLDLYYDLRERHLLPLVAILLVAIVALPIALSGGSSGSESAESEAAAATPGAPLPSSKLIVAKAAPGLRDYRGRLAGAPKDPFEAAVRDTRRRRQRGRKLGRNRRLLVRRRRRPAGHGRTDDSRNAIDPARNVAGRRQRRTVPGRAAEVLLLRDRRPRRPGLLRRRR